MQILVFSEWFAPLTDGDWLAKALLEKLAIVGVGRCMPIL